MYFITRIFTRLSLLSLLFLSMQASAEQPPTAEVDGNSGKAHSTDVADEKVLVPGYGRFNLKPPAVAIPVAKDEPKSMLWPLLLGGGTVIAMIGFWLRRRSAKPSLPLEAPRAVVPVANKNIAEKAETQYWIPLDQATTVTVDELDSVEEEAEVFVLLGRMDMAIGVLRQNVGTHPAAPAHVWMNLLEVLRAQRLRKEFEALAIEIKERFNVALPTWTDAAEHDDDLTGLEHFPHLLAKITAHWKKSGCLTYLHELTQDNRNGKREGFRMDAFREILTLIGVLEIRQKMQNHVVEKSPPIGPKDELAAAWQLINDAESLLAAKKRR